MLTSPTSPDPFEPPSGVLIVEVDPQLRADLARTVGLSPCALVFPIADHGAQALHAQGAGSRGYLLQDASDDEIARTFRDLLARHSSRRAVPEAPGRDTDEAEGLLSRRESEILALVAHGHTAPEVARRLGRSLHTVNTHLRNCYAKLAARNRIDAVARARRRGLID